MTEHFILEDFMLENAIIEKCRKIKENVDKLSKEEVTYLENTL